MLCGPCRNEILWEACQDIEASGEECCNDFLVFSQEMCADIHHDQIVIYAIGASRVYGFFLIHSFGCYFFIVLNFDIALVLCIG